MNTVEKLEQSNIVPLVQDQSNPMTLISTALASGASVETLERLMGLQERWQAGEARKSYGTAMNAAQGEMRPVSQDASNKQTSSKYATYHALNTALRPIYIKHGFALSFDTADTDRADCVRIVCRITHKDGHTEIPHLDMPSDGKGAKGGDVMTKTHATGAAITYGRRYLLGMIFNIAVGEDNDGNARKALEEGTNPITADEFIFLRNLIDELKADEKKVLLSVNATEMETMTQKQYREAVVKLQAWQKTIKEQAAKALAAKVQP